MMKKAVPVLVALLLAGIAAFVLWPRPPVRSVTIYTSVDQVFSEPVLKAFEKASGIRVDALYDAEAAKTVGLVNRLIAEKANPLADVFWNGEILQTLALRDEGVLAPHRAKAAALLPPRLVDPDGYWTAIGGRARVLLVNTRLVAEADRPKSLFDLVPRAKQVAIANPLFGSTATQAAALGAALGVEKSVRFFADLRAAGAQVVDGNAVVRDVVAAGRVPMGLTDTDDACEAITRGDPVAVTFLDQGDGGLGTLVVPNSIALVRGAPHAEAAKALIEYLTAPETEAALIEAGWIQIPSRPTKAKAQCYGELALRVMEATMPAIRAAGAEIAPRLRAIFQN